ncbi:MAG: MSMEG_0567/Sll0786 family nitrogen starvation N-acetyltransferase [Acidimicrobiales bacterium]
MRPTPAAPEALPALTTCRMVASPEEIALHHLIRQEVFVAEQAVFTGDDADDVDGHPATVKVVAWLGDAAAGTVRCYPTSADGRRWQGDRLAVRRAFRRRDVGAPLVRFAVATAAAQGGRTMTAHIQLPNVAFFEALGWRRAGATETYVGLPHQPMDIALSGPAAR